MFSTETFLKCYSKFNHYLLSFLLYLHVSTEVLIIMSTPGQKRVTCGHISARDVETRGLETIRLSSRKIVLSARHSPQSRFNSYPAPTYRNRKNKDKKTVSDSPTPTLVDALQVNVLGQVEGEKLLRSLKPPLLARRKDLTNLLKPARESPAVDLLLRI